jgi:hypothetical protein
MTRIRAGLAAGVSIRRVVHLLIIGLCLGAAGGCAGDSADAPRNPLTSAPANGSPHPVDIPRPRRVIQADSPLVQRLWAPVGSLPRLAPTLPRFLDTAAIERAPSLSDAPLDVAVMAVGTDPAPYSVGGVAVMSPDGDWRVIDRERLDMRDPGIVEQQYKLRPNGRTLALGDEHGIVLLDISTGVPVRVPTRANDVVLHAWSHDSSELIFTPRTADRTLSLDVADQTIRQVKFDAWASAVGSDGRIAEFVQRADEPKPVYTGVKLWQAGVETETVPLEVALLPDTTIGRPWDTLVAVFQRPRRSAPDGAARGVMALDPQTGEANAFLVLGRRQATWASVVGITQDGWLLVQTSHGPGGGVAAWDPVEGRLRGVIAFDDVATSVSIAARVLANL